MISYFRYSILIIFLLGANLPAHEGDHHLNNEIFGEKLEIDSGLHERMMDHNHWKRNIEGYIRSNSVKLKGDLLKILLSASNLLDSSSEGDKIKVSLEDSVLYKLAASNAAVVFPKDQEISAQILNVCEKDRTGELFPGTKIMLASRLSRSGSLHEDDLLFALIEANVFNKVEEMALFHGLRDRLNQNPNDKEAVGAVIAILHESGVDSGLDEELIKYSRSIGYDIDQYLKKRRERKTRPKEERETSLNSEQGSQPENNFYYIFIIPIIVVGLFCFFIYKKKINKA